MLAAMKRLPLPDKKIHRGSWMPCRELSITVCFHYYNDTHILSARKYRNIYKKYIQWTAMYSFSMPVGKLYWVFYWSSSFYWTFCFDSKHCAQYILMIRLFFFKYLNPADLLWEPIHNTWPAKICTNQPPEPERTWKILTFILRSFSCRWHSADKDTETAMNRWYDVNVTIQFLQVYFCWGPCTC